MSVLSPTLWAMITSTKFNWERHFPIQMEIFRISSKGLLITVHFWHHLANIVIIIIIIIIVIIIGIYYLQYNAVNAKWMVVAHDLKNEFTQHDGRKKRTAKHLCVTKVTGVLLGCFFGIFTWHLIFFCSSTKDFLKECEV